MTEHRRRLLKRKLQESRYRLYKKDMDFASQLKEMIFVATKDVRRISTNGRCIYLDPDWLQKLGKTELDFMLAHQIMHIVLGHIDRPKYYKGDRFHLACDIVANSTLTLYGWEYDKLPNVGEIFCETFYPTRKGLNLTPEEAFECIPFDPAARRKGRNTYVIDSEIWWDKKDDCGNDGVILLSPQDEDPDDLDCDEPATEIIHPKFQKVIYEKKEEVDEMPEEVEGEETTSSSNWTTDSAQNIEQLRHEKNKSKSMGDETNFYERVWRRYSDGTLDWRSLLSSFIQEEVCDYSFVPPDRRMQEFDVYLPDYNVLTETPKKVLFIYNVFML